MIPELFTPITIRGITIPNRIMLPPMCIFSAVDGMAGDFHFAHYSNRAIGKVGLIVVEATGIVPSGRISPSCLGLWKDEQIAPLKKITDFIRSQGCVSSIQINHSGRRGSCNEIWKGLKPLTIEQGGFPIYAPTLLPYKEGALIPKELNEKDILEIEENFVSAAIRAIKAGFDSVEIHAAHGFLIHEFLSPITNKRTDKYGGSLENRQRFLLEITEKIRKIMPDKILMVRMSCVDYAPNGWTIEDTVNTVKKLKTMGVDILDCSSGGIASDYQDSPKPGFQVPYATKIKNETGIIVACVGGITNPEQANEILKKKEGDIIAVGREMLKNSFWPFDCADVLKHEMKWANQLFCGTKSGNPYKH